MARKNFVRKVIEESARKRGWEDWTKSEPQRSLNAPHGHVAPSWRSAMSQWALTFALKLRVRTKRETLVVGARMDVHGVRTPHRRPLQNLSERCEGVTEGQPHHPPGDVRSA